MSRVRRLAWCALLAACNGESCVRFDMMMEPAAHAWSGGASFGSVGASSPHIQLVTGLTESIFDPTGGTQSFIYATTVQPNFGSAGAAVKVHQSTQAMLSGANPSTGITGAELSVGTSGGTTTPSYSGTPTKFSNITIPANGAEWVSTLTNVTLGSDGRLTISHYFPTGIAASYVTGTNTATYYGIPGSTYPLPSLSPVSNHLWWQLITIEYQTTAARVIVLGDSLVDGFSMNGDKNQTWCNLLSADGYATNCWGLASSTVDDYNTKAQITALLTTISGSVVTIALGINNLFLLHQSAATLEASFTTLIGTMHSAGARKIVLMTMAPFNLNTTDEATRVAVNAWMRAGVSNVDAVIDSLGAVTYNPSNPSQLLPADDAGDGHHWTVAANATVHTAALTVLQSL